MQIEAGKYYRTRDGAIAGPAEANSSPGHDDWVWFIETNDGGAYYRDDGSCPYLPEYDIIGEVSHTQLDLAHAEIPGIDIARILVEFRDEFRGVYPMDVLYSMTTAVGPMQSLIGLAIRNGHLKLGDRK